MSRQMPKAGFYVMHGRGEYSDLVSDGHIECIYTTGIRGGGGHKMYRVMGGMVAGTTPRPSVWGTLLWSCVPSQKDLNTNYDYYQTYSAIPKSCKIPKP